MTFPRTSFGDNLALKVINPAIAGILPIPWLFRLDFTPDATLHSR